MFVRPVVLQLLKELSRLDETNSVFIVDSFHCFVSIFLSFYCIDPIRLDLLGASTSLRIEKVSKMFAYIFENGSQSSDIFGNNSRKPVFSQTMYFNLQLMLGLSLQRSSKFFVYVGNFALALRLLVNTFPPRVNYGSCNVVVTTKSYRVTTQIETKPLLRNTICFLVFYKIKFDFVTLGS